MRRRRSSNRAGQVKLILPVLLLINVIQLSINYRLNSKLADILIFDWQEDGITIFSGKEASTPITVITPSFINNTTAPKSPFNDGKTFTQLIEEYVKYGSSDMYGSPRRTGDIRRIHEGVDFYVPEDTPVYPVFPIGVVTEVQDDPHYIIRSTGYRHGVYVDSVGVEYGKIVRVLYPEGIESLYAHLNEIFVQEGQLVYSNTALGTSGYTGNIRLSGKPSHLHIELRDVNDNSFDPEHRLHYNQISIDVFINEILSRLQ